MLGKVLQSLYWIAFGINIIFVVTLIFITSALFKQTTNENIHIYLSKRNLFVLFPILIWSIIFILIRNLQIFGSILQSFALYYELELFLQNFFIFGLWLLFLLRTWLIFYNYQIGFAMVTMTMNTILDPDIERKLIRFVRNGRRYTSLKYLFPRAIALPFSFWTLILVSPTIRRHSFFTLVYVIFISFVYIIIIIGCIVCMKHIYNTLHDVFYIHQEILINFCVMILLILCGILYPFSVYIDNTGFVQYLFIEISSFCIFIMCYISTYWVFNKIKQELRHEERITIDKETNVLRLTETLKNRTTVQQFMQYLVKELSGHYIFFLADIMAYKQAFVTHNKVDKIYGFKCSLPQAIARLKLRRAFTHYAWAITKTYVDSWAMTYIKELKNETQTETIDGLSERSPQMEDNGTTELFQELQIVFDKCGIEVWELLQNAHSRYVSRYITPLVYGYIRQCENEYMLSQRVPDAISAIVLLFFN